MLIQLTKKISLPWLTFLHKIISMTKKMCMIMTLTSAIFSYESILATAIVVVVVVVDDDVVVVVVVVVVVAATAPMPGLMAGESGKDAKSIAMQVAASIAQRYYSYCAIDK